MALTKISTAMISQSAAAVDLNVDAGTFYVDTTNNRVGVGGKTDPDTPLHVIGTVTATTFAGSGASLTDIPNSALTNSSITINSTAVSLGGSLTLTTANIAENTNLYYTDARADARIAAADTDDLSEGSSNLYYTDARVDARVSGGSLGNITTTGYIRGPATFTLDPAAHGDDTGTVVIAGNLQVDGVTTTINSTTLTVDDKNITLASGSANAAAASGAGFTVDIGSGTLPAITYDGTNDEWDFNKPLNVTGNIAVSGTVDGIDIAARDAVLTSTTTTAGAALPKAGGTMTGGLSIRGFNGPVLKLGSSGTSDPRIDFEDQNSTNLGAGIFLDQDADTLRILRTVSGSATDGIAINASGNVGIGTGAPSQKLQVNGNIGFTKNGTTGNRWLLIDGADATYAGTMNIQAGFGSTAAGGAVKLYAQAHATYPGSVWLGRGAGAAGNIMFGNGGTGPASASQIQMVINSSGNVGIGVTDPDVRLEVKGISAVPSTTAQIFSVTNTTGGTRLDLGVQENTIAWLQSREGSTLRNLSLNPLGGNVGIGTTSPGHRLDVEGGNNVFDLARFGSSASDNSEVTIGYFDANANNGIPALIGASDFGGLIQGGDNGHLVLGIRDNDATDALDIVSGGGNFMTDTTYDTLVATFKANGNVGIGTDAPGWKFVVQGAGTGSGLQDGHVMIRSTTAANPAGLMFINSGNTASYNDLGSIQGIVESGNAKGALRFITRNSDGNNTDVAERMRITSAGNVGIGTDDPDARLGIKSSGASSYPLLIKSSDNQQLFRFREESDTRGTFYINDASENSKVTLSSSGNSSFMGGNVGIGTDSPYSKLEVAGMAADSYTATNFNNVPAITIKHANTNTNYGGIRFTNTSGNYEHFFGAVQTSTNTADMVFQGHNRSAGAYQEFMRISETGNVGIGVQSPFSRLQSGSHTFSGVNGMYTNSRVGISNHGTLTGMMLASTYNDSTYPEYGLVFVQGPSTSSYNVWSISPEGPAKGDSLHFIYGDSASNIHTTTPKVTFDGNGNVGIGTTSPSYKLHISGPIADQAPLLLGTVTGTPGSGFNWAAEFMAANLPQDKRIVIALGKARSNSNSGTISYVQRDDSNNNAIAFGHFGANDLVNFTQSGKVGIGTTTPVAALDVLGKFNVQNGQVWSETTQGGNTGSIHIDPNSATDHAGGAITFGASDTGNGTSAMAGIYVRSDGSYGTNMYLSTTDTYAYGSQTAIAIMYEGDVLQPRQSRFQAYGASTSYNPLTYSHSVKYPNTSYNIGADYSGTTGLYTAPQDGYYIFEASIYSTTTASNGWGQAWLTINGGRGSFTDKFSNTGSNGGGVSIISTIHTIYLSQGDTVGYHPYTSSGSGYAFYNSVHHTWFRGRFIG